MSSPDGKNLANFSSSLSDIFMLWAHLLQRYIWSDTEIIVIIKCDAVTSSMICKYGFNNWTEISFCLWQLALRSYLAIVSHYSANISTLLSQLYGKGRLILLGLRLIILELLPSNKLTSPQDSLGGSRISLCDWLSIMKWITLSINSRKTRSLKDLLRGRRWINDKRKVL